MTQVLPTAVEFHFHAVPKLPEHLVSRESFRKYCHSYDLSQAPNPHPRKCPCLRCHGKGKIRDIKDHDPVEGWKGAPWYECKTCGGTGEDNPEHFWGVFQHLKDNALQQLKQHKEIRTMQESMFKALKNLYAPVDLRLAGFHNPKGLKHK